HQMRLEKMTDVLRRDVWNAVKIDLPDPQAIDLTRADGSTIRWRFSISAVARSATDEQRWTLAEPMLVRHDGATLLLRCEAKRDDQADEWRFSSAMLTNAAENNR